jgi:hypothetical protein
MNNEKLNDKESLTIITGERQWFCPKQFFSLVSRMIIQARAVSIVPALMSNIDIWHLSLPNLSFARI